VLRSVFRSFPYIDERNFLVSKRGRYLLGRHGWRTTEEHEWLLCFYVPGRGAGDFLMPAPRKRQGYPRLLGHSNIR
jgi:hypothetical protein